MTAYPAAGDYYKAVQAPARVFTVPKLQAAEFVWDSLGPTLARGSSAVVFQASVEGRPQALRCYIRNDASSRDRYSALDAYLAAHDLSPYVSGTTWLDEAIQVNRATWPVLTMDWIDGRTLNEYVDFLVTGSNAAALTTLAAKWRELVALLQNSEFTHGDLQHGNIMVDQAGRIRLVDFDGVWIPQLAGQSPPTEFGHPNYQHPMQHVWGRWLDTFSALVIYLSLVALGKDPGTLAGALQLQEPAVRQERLLPPVQDRGLEAAGRDGRPAGQRARPAAAGVLRSGLGVHQEPGDDPRPAGRDPGAAADPGRAALVGEKARGGPGSAVTGSRFPVPRVPPRGGFPRPPGRRLGPTPPAHRQPPRVVRGHGTAQAATAKIAAGSLPAPPPLSAPLGLAGTGPMPQLSQTMAPPGATTWWSAPGSASAQVRPGPGPYGPAPPGPVPPRRPHGSVPRGPVPPAPGSPMPGPSAPAPPASATKPLPGPVAGAIALGLGIVLLIIGAVSHFAVIVIVGLVAAAWGIWRLVTRTGPGSNAKPPGQT